MKKHTKVYFKHFGLTQADWIGCEVCGKSAVDIHHVNGRGKGKDVIENLIALCRDCHIKAHNHEISKQELYESKEKRQ